MNRRSLACAISALALLSSGHVQAGALADLTAGTHVVLNDVRLSVGGATYEMPGWVLPKSPGTLDLDVPASTFGLPTSQLIHLRATVVGGVVSWVINHYFTPAIALSAGSQVEHVSGTLKVAVSRISGFTTPRCLAPLACERNVKLSKAPGSELTLEGSGPLGVGWRYTVTLDGFDAVGGAAAPALDGFGASSARLCSRRTAERDVPLGVSLRSPAPAGGAQVSLKSSDPRKIGVQATVLVAPGQLTAFPLVRIAKNYAGTVTISAAANGVVIEKSLTISAPGDCERLGSPFTWSAFTADAPTRFIAHNGQRESLALVNGAPTLYRQGAKIDLTSTLGARSLTATGLSELGAVFGTLVTAAGATSAFKAEFDFGSGLKLLGAFTPTAVSDRGTVFGYRTGASGPIGVVHGGALLDLRIAARWNKPTAVSADGLKVAGQLSLDGVRTSAFVHSRGTLRVLPTIGSTAADPVAVDSTGTVAANAGGVAVVVDASNSVTRINPPSGYTHVRVTAMNENGLVVGTATSASRTAGFVWSAQAGLVLLDTLAPRQAGMVVLEALHITEDNQVVVSAQLPHQTAALYVLSF